MMADSNKGGRVEMTKILLVGDDKNLSEIYKVRLEAEGYQILSAPDGECPRCCRA